MFCAIRLRFVALLCGFLALLVQALGDEPKSPVIKRIITKVPPEKLSPNRSHDERPAEFRVSKELIDGGRRIDLASLRVVRVDGAGGKEISEPLPLRWYDDSIPVDFPECEQNAHATDGTHLTFISRPHWGEFYNLLGEGASGRLVWLHRQEKEEAAYYEVSFRPLPAGEVPAQPPPRGFVGDVSPRCLPTGATSTGMIHSRVCVSDWNADGLPDLLVGGSTGKILFYPNRGTKSEPRYSYARLVTTTDGKPLDVGWSSAPLVVDWDGDGLVDLLSGAERNCILFYKNEGEPGAPRLVNRGFVTVRGERLTLPVTPVPKSPPGVYLLDYYPVLDAVDWNHDGRLDLLAGGFVTGRIYFFENTGKQEDGTPKLLSRGPLESDGKPLNVGDWAAAPCAADFDSDGDLDLISGNMSLNAGGGDSLDAAHFLRYYENVGSRTEPRLVERPFPKSGKFPSAGLGTPRAVDFNGDGLLDLVVSASEYIYLYQNRGTGAAPLFEVHAQPIPCSWGSVPLPTFGVQFVDWDGDQKLDLFSSLTVYRNKGRGEFVPDPLLVSGERIDHPAHRGDGWIFTQIYDLDGDGDLDLLFGTHDGQVWLHANDGKKPRRFDEAGARLLLEDGQPIQVGPSSSQPLDFDVLQGSRTTFTVGDFNRDGLPDLVVGDTYGKTRLFRNAGPRTSPRFAAPVLLGDMKIRMTPYAADWDGDGQLDVVGSAAGGDVVLWRNLGSGRFGAATPLKFPAVPYSPMVAAVDWNQDGDLDLVVGTAYGFFCWFERSFLEGGYAQARHVR
jgi:hypothetical protein